MKHYVQGYQGNSTEARKQCCGPVALYDMCSHVLYVLPWAVCAAVCGVCCYVPYGQLCAGNHIYD